MNLIIAIVLGLIAGQYIKLTVDPTLIDFFKSSWALATEKIGEAIETAKMGPKQRAVKGAFKQLDSEAKAKEGAIDAATPTT
jgi:hypothetical protein